MQLFAVLQRGKLLRICFSQLVIINCSAIVRAGGAKKKDLTPQATNNLTDLLKGHLLLLWTLTLVYLSFRSCSIYTKTWKNSRDTVGEVVKRWEKRRWWIGVKTNFQPVWENSHSLPQAVFCLPNDLIITLLLLLYLWFWFIIFMPFHFWLLIWVKS